VIIANELRDGNVPAGAGNRRVVDKALPALPRGIDKIYLRGDSALYEHELMGFLDAPAIGYAISAEMNPQLAEWHCRSAGASLEARSARDPRDPRVGRGQLFAERWDPEKRTPSPRRYPAIRICLRQGELLRDGNQVRASASSPTVPTPQLAAAST
jgi:hypothetical protein